MEGSVKKRGDACACLHRYLTYSRLYRTYYEDDTCFVKLEKGLIIASAYEVDGERRIRIGECIMKIW